MKFAIVNGVKKEAEPKETGTCICCGSDVRAYCGTQKVHHWKHINLEKCDTWYEGETEWHRKWKNYFDDSFQEYVMFDIATGEKHIADIYIPNKGLTIEFQHSPISLEEITAREQFYKKMIWVVDVQQYEKNIGLHSTLSEFGELIEYPWAVNQDRMYRELKKDGKITEAENLRSDNTEWHYLQEFEKKYRYGKFKEDYRLMTWKYQHKRWNSATKPLFFDINDGYIYYVIEAINVWSGFIVKRFKIDHFVSHYANI